VLRPLYYILHVAVCARRTRCRLLRRLSVIHCSLHNTPVIPRGSHGD
jgi:hypothetical protein